MPYLKLLFFRNLVSEFSETEKDFAEDLKTMENEIATKISQLHLMVIDSIEKGSTLEEALAQFINELFSIFPKFFNPTLDIPLLDIRSSATISDELLSKLLHQIQYQIKCLQVISGLIVLNFHLSYGYCFRNTPFFVTNVL